MEKYDSKMKQYLMSVPAIIIISIVLPCLVELLMEWVVLHDHGQIPNAAYYTIYVIFAIYAGVVAYFRGRKIWQKLIIFVIVFFIQNVILILIVYYEFGITMAAFN
jgi:hypothetical protein